MNENTQFRFWLSFTCIFDSGVRGCIFFCRWKIGQNECNYSSSCSGNSTNPRMCSLDEVSRLLGLLACSHAIGPGSGESMTLACSFKRAACCAVFADLSCKGIWYQMVLMGTQGTSTFYRNQLESPFLPFLNCSGKVDRNLHHFHYSFWELSFFFY